MGFGSKGNVSQTPAWIAYLLLVVGIFAPVICVIWLVRKTVENENEAYRKLLDDSDARLLADAETSLLEGLVSESVALDAFAEVHEFGSLAARPERDEVEAARTAVSRFRESIENLDSGDVEGLIRTFLGSDDAWLRLPGGRVVGAVVLQLGLEHLPRSMRDSLLTGEVLDFVERFVSSESPINQKKYLLGGYESLSRIESVARFLEREAFVDQWVSALRSRGNYPPVAATGKAGGAVYVYEENAGRAKLFPIGRLPEMAEVILDGERARAQLIAEASAEVGSVENRWMVRNLEYPLDDFALRVDRSILDGEHENNRSFDYVWIGAIVLGLSVVSGGAMVVTLRRQASVAQLKDDLIATVTHELKTPISSIRLLVETLLDEERRGKVDTLEYLELVSRENERLGRLIENFLSFSRLERGKGSFARERIDPKEVVDKAVQAFEERFKEATYSLDVNCQDDSLEVLGDVDALVTVVGNLLENAFKYGDENRQIRLSLSDEGKFAVFRVRDFGRGISRRDQKRIFRKFFQVSPDESGHAGSVGLGLSIVEFIVGQHGGFVDVSSELGQGSTFSIYIPHA